MANGNGLLNEMRVLLDNDEVPEKMTRRALWGVMAVVYKKLDETCAANAEFQKDSMEFRKVSMDDRKNLNKTVHVLGGLTGLLLVINLPDLAKSADSLWKLILALL